MGVHQSSKLPFLESRGKDCPMGSLLFRSLLVNGGRNASLSLVGGDGSRSSVVGIGSASSIGPIWLSSKGGWGAARFGQTSVPDVLGACVKVERFKTAVRKGKLKTLGSTSLFSAEEGFFFKVIQMVK